MTTRPAPTTDDPMADRIAAVMRWGVIAAGTVFAVGLTLDLLRLSGPARVAAAVGCAVLVALPAARLVLMVRDFARRRDVAFTVITFGVLVLTAGSLVVGLLW